jgi:hypothetical protein
MKMPNQFQAQLLAGTHAVETSSYRSVGASRLFAASREIENDLQGSN